MKKIILWTIFATILILIGLRADAASAATESLIISQLGENTNCTVTDLNFNYVAQDFFHTSGFQLGTAKIYLRKRLTGSLTGNATLYITDPGRVIIYGELPFDMSVLTTTLTAYDFDFTNQNIHIDKNISYELFFAPDNILLTNAIIARYNTNPFQDSVGTIDCPFTGYTGPGDLKYQIYGYPDAFNLSWIIPTALAATECTFVTNGATTTTECTDPTITNTTQDIATGIFIFCAFFFGILFYFRR